MSFSAKPVPEIKRGDITLFTKNVMLVHQDKKMSIAEAVEHIKKAHAILTRAAPEVADELYSLYFDTLNTFINKYSKELIQKLRSGQNGDAETITLIELIELLQIEIYQRFRLERFSKEYEALGLHKQQKKFEEALLKFNPNKNVFFDLPYLNHITQHVKLSLDRAEESSTADDFTYNQHAAGISSVHEEFFKVMKEDSFDKDFLTISLAQKITFLYLLDLVSAVNQVFIQKKPLSEIDYSFAHFHQALELFQNNKEPLPVLVESRKVEIDILFIKRAFAKNNFDLAKTHLDSAKSQYHHIQKRFEQNPDSVFISTLRQSIQDVTLELALKIFDLTHDNKMVDDVLATEESIKRRFYNLEKMTVKSEKFTRCVDHFFLQYLQMADEYKNENDCLERYVQVHGTILQFKPKTRVQIEAFFTHSLSRRVEIFYAQFCDSLHKKEAKKIVKFGALALGLENLSFTKNIYRQLYLAMNIVMYGINETPNFTAITTCSLGKDILQKNLSQLKKYDTATQRIMKEARRFFDKALSGEAKSVTFESKPTNILEAIHQDSKPTFEAMLKSTPDELKEEAFILAFNQQKDFFCYAIMNEITASGRKRLLKNLEKNPSLPLINALLLMECRSETDTRIRPFLFNIAAKLFCGFLDGKVTFTAQHIQLNQHKFDINHLGDYLYDMFHFFENKKPIKLILENITTFFIFAKKESEKQKLYLISEIKACDSFKQHQLLFRERNRTRHYFVLLTEQKDDSFAHLTQEMKSPNLNDDITNELEQLEKTKSELLNSLNKDFINLHDLRILTEQVNQFKKMAEKFEEKIAKLKADFASCKEAMKTHLGKIKDKNKKPSSAASQGVFSGKKDQNKTSPAPKAKFCF